MREITNASMLKKVSKQDIVFFFQTLMNDRNIMHGHNYRLQIYSAAYEKKPVDVEKRLRIKFYVTRKETGLLGREFYYYEISRQKNWMGDINVELSRSETLRELMDKKKDIIEKYNGSIIVPSILSLLEASPVAPGKWAEKADLGACQAIENALRTVYGFKGDPINNVMTRKEDKSTASYSKTNQMFVLHIEKPKK